MSVFVEVANLGPLRSAALEMADLTLLIGENNTGKTFFATVLHRVLVAPHQESWPRGRLGEREVPDEVLEWIEARWAAEDDETAGDVTIEQPAPEAVSEWAVAYTTARLSAFGAAVREGVEYAYGVDASSLRRRTATRRAGDCFLKVRSAELAWEVEVRFDSEDIKVTPPDPRAWLGLLIGGEHARRSRRGSPERSRARLRQPPTSRFPSRGYFYWGFRDELFRGWPQFAVHLPANRTGFMAGRQVLASEVVRQSASAGIRPIAVNPLPGTSADFLALLIADNDRRQAGRRKDPRFGALLEELEGDLRAEIMLQEGSTGVDAVVARTPEGEFPLACVSSMLSELAPIILVVRGALGLSDHITIDEPEAHLHPAMQRRIASFLAAVASRGTGVVATTHSDFFLGQINNLIRAGELAIPGIRDSRKDNPGPRKPTVCALRFARSERWCVGEQLDLDPVDGIDESTFTDVMESLYDDSARLVNELL